ncbi:DNA primase [Georgenia yuyongxinii]|uniref:DNA primase n=1 Tax=Georgenia yuyongxinii TaxID=2589797 RepID=A0A552WVU3_9MICO|nr:DNA primase [Georgenia yuyongxinii]TRW46887.1 DNA primase [Georgenia yuyongxinii]
MAGLIRREDIDAVRERARIEEVVGTYVTLKTAGVGSQKGLCPFHDERTASFHVRPQLGLWHCFGCDEGGDVISFVQKIDHLSFTEAVEHLASKVGVQLRYEDGGTSRPREEPGRRQRLIEAHRVAEEFYATQLDGPEGETGRRFLAERGFDRQAAATFGVGYAPKGWDHLMRHLRGRGFTEAELTASGLVSQGNRGIYDRFRGRLVWPIRDITAETVGFGARRLYEDDQGPKYLNTPETPIYKKSHVLYGLDLAKRAIAKERKVVVVEGYTDVMAAHLAGVGTAVATCGTAFGTDHVKIVRRLLGDTDDAAAGVILASGATRGGEVIFTFDGDAAGQKAALRAFEEDQRFASQTFVAVGPDGMDPCDLRLQRGDEAVRELVTGREPLFAFAIRSVLRQLDLATAEGRVAALRAASPVVAGIRDQALRWEYTRELAGWLGMDEPSVRQAVQGAQRAGGRPEMPVAVLAPGGAGGWNGGGNRRGSASDSRSGDRRSWDTRGEGGARGARTSRDGGGYSGRRYDDGRDGFRDISAAPGSMPGGHRPPREDPVARLERQVLEVVLQLPQHALGAGFDDLAPDTFTVPAYRGVHDAIRAAGGTFAYGQEVERHAGAQPGGDAARHAAAWWAEQVRENAVGPVAGVITELAVTPLPEDRPDALAGYAQGVLVALIRMGLTRQIADVKGRLQRTDPADSAYQQVFADLVALESRRRALSRD